MRGFIKKRGNSWRVAVSLGRDPQTGKYQYLWETVKGTKREAEKRMAELIHQHDSGILNKPGKGTVAEYLTNWLRDFITPNLSPRTSEGYEVIIRRHAIPALGKIALTQLKPEHIQGFYADKLSSGLSARTVRHFHMCLHGAFKNAVKTGSLVRNPCDATNPPKDQKTEMRTMSESDIHIFLEYARNTEYYPIFYLALFTGMRRSEILALRWSDVELLAPIQISVNRALHQLKKGKIDIRTTKTEKSRRLIPISPSTAIVLREYRESQDKIREALRIPALSDSDFVFCHVDGKPYLPNTVSHAWIKLVRKCGLRGIRLHDARHTMASIMLKNGINAKIIQERLGHSSISITLDTYSHLIPSMQEAAANAFDEFVLPKQRVRE